MAETTVQHKGMRFISVPARAKYVVRPMLRSTDSFGRPYTEKGLTARFINHMCDTGRLQQEKGWTDEERVEVERYLLGHRDNGAHNGFYQDLIAEGLPAGPQRIVDLPAAARNTRCIAFLRNERGELEQCGLEAVEEDYCSGHFAEVKAAREEAAREEALVESGFPAAKEEAHGVVRDTAGGGGDGGGGVHPDSDPHGFDSPDVDP